MRVGIIACSILQMEITNLLSKLDWEPEIVFLDGALHVNPKNMRQEIVRLVNEMAERVDAVFLGYGFCQSLEGIEKDCSIAVILPQIDDCISLLLGPEGYAREVKKEVGTWFMTPGWAEVEAEMVIKELHLDRVTQYGKDPMVMARRLFTHYRRGLYIDTGVGDREKNLVSAEKFCRDFNLTLEKTEAEPNLLEEWLLKAKALADDVSANRRR